jgi:tetratricopeptide (TPR) repeat protein
MSFGIQCPQCGAPSSPSTGICPYCFHVFKAPHAAVNPSIASLFEKYSAGDLSSALANATLLEEHTPELIKDPDFLLLYLKILIESDGPTFKMRKIVALGLAQPKLRAEFILFNDVIDAIESLHGDNFSSAETKLNQVLTTNPANTQALFLLGAHYFWKRNQPSQALRFLEKCVSLQPNFLRAWGCLAALYESLNNLPLAMRAYQKCAEIETEPRMKEFFNQSLKRLANPTA